MTNTSENSNINQGGVPGEQELDTIENVKQLTTEQVPDWDRQIKGPEEEIRQFLVDLENNKAHISPEEKAKIESQADQILKAMEQIRSALKGGMQNLEMMSKSHDQEGKE